MCRAVKLEDGKRTTARGAKFHGEQRRGYSTPHSFNKSGTVS